MGFDEISVTLPTFNGIAIRSVSGRHFGKLADSNVSKDEVDTLSLTSTNSQHRSDDQPLL